MVCSVQGDEAVGKGDVMADLIYQGTVFSRAAADSVDGLTRVMILHPIACAIAFLAFALSMGAGVIGSVLGALVALVAWVLTVVVMAIDFALFGVSLPHPFLFLSSLPAPRLRAD